MSTPSDVTGIWKPLTKVDRAVVIAATVWFLIAGSLAVFSTHTFSFFPDSKKHYFVIDSLRQGHWPLLTRDPITMEAHQPPLFHLTALPWDLIGRHWSTDMSVVLIRYWSLLVSSLSIVMTALIVRQLFPDRRYLPAVAAMFIGLNPQLYVMSAQVNNDGFAGALGTATLLMMVLAMRGWSNNSRRQWLIGVVAALAFLTKMSLWPLSVALVLTAWWTSRWQWRTLVRLGLPLFLVAVPWLIRNWVVYGDPTVWRLMRQYWWDDQHRIWLSLSGIQTWLNLVYETYWTRFRHLVVGLHAYEYTALKIMGVLAIVGVVKFILTGWRQLETVTRRSLLVLGASAVVVFGGVVSYSVSFYQPWGRYLFPVQAVIALGLGLGLESLFPKRYVVLVPIILVLCLAALNAEALRLVVMTG